MCIHSPALPPSIQSRFTGFWRNYEQPGTLAPGPRHPRAFRNGRICLYLGNSILVDRIAPARRFTHLDIAVNYPVIDRHSRRRRQILDLLCQVVWRCRCRMGHPTPRRADYRNRKFVRLGQVRDTGRSWSLQASRTGPCQRLRCAREDKTRRLR